jgi:hypothetical protein
MSNLLDNDMKLKGIAWVGKATRAKIDVLASWFRYVGHTGSLRAAKTS